MRWDSGYLSWKWRWKIYQEKNNEDFWCSGFDAKVLWLTILQLMCTSCFTLIPFRGKSFSAPSMRTPEPIWTIGGADQLLLRISRLSYWLYRCQVRLCKAELSLNNVFEADDRDREKNIENDAPQSQIFWDKWASFEKSGRYVGRQAHKNARNWWIPVKKPSDRTDTF